MDRRLADDVRDSLSPAHRALRHADCGRDRVWLLLGGWLVIATATVAGSLASFLTSRTVFSKFVHRHVGRDKRFVALSQVLRHDGLGMLTLIRLCPLPYSLSNGFLSTIPTLRPWAFAAATAMAR